MTPCRTSIPSRWTVIQNGLIQVCNEMDLAFVRSAFSPVISEAWIAPTASTTRPTGVIAQGELGCR